MASLSLLTSQLSNALTRASALCAEIKHNRRVGKQGHHEQLDGLEESLADGPRWVKREVERVDLKGEEDCDGTLYFFSPSLLPLVGFDRAGELRDRTREVLEWEAEIVFLKKRGERSKN